MSKIIIIFLMFIIMSCTTDKYAVLEIKADKNTEWSILLDEYSTTEGYRSYDEKIHGKGSKSIMFDNLQHLGAIEYTGADVDLEIYELANGKKIYTGEKLRTGRVYWWRYLKKVPLSYFE